MSECCCGCGKDASKSNHYCVHTNKRVMAWCCDIDKQPKQWKNIANKTINIYRQSIFRPSRGVIYIQGYSR